MMKNSKPGKYIAIAIGSVFTFIIGGIILLHLPLEVRKWCSILTTAICFLIFGAGLYFIPKLALKIKEKEPRTIILIGSIIMLSNYIFMYITYAFGYEKIYPYLYGLGFNLIGALSVALLAVTLKLKVGK